MGAILGNVGYWLPQDLRIALASLSALAAIAMGSLELGGRRTWLMQCDKETPQRWLKHGALRWAARNGFTLGCGFTTRIGFWLWYVVPVGSLLLARPGLGALLYGTYAAARAMAVWGIIYGLGRRLPPDIDYARWLLDRNDAARMITAGYLLVLGVAFTIGIGF